MSNHNYVRIRKNKVDTFLKLVSLKIRLSQLCFPGEIPETDKRGEDLYWLVPKIVSVHSQLSPLNLGSMTSQRQGANDGEYLLPSQRPGKRKDGRGGEEGAKESSQR